MDIHIWWMYTVKGVVHIVDDATKIDEWLNAMRIQIEQFIF